MASVPIAADPDQNEVQAETRTALERLSRAIGNSPSDDERRALHFRSAQIYLQLPGDEPRDAAIEHLWAAWEIGVGDQDVLFVLAACLERAGRQADLARLYQEAGRNATDPFERAALLLAAADHFAALGEAPQAWALREEVTQLGGAELRSARRLAARHLTGASEQAAPAEIQARAWSALLAEQQDELAYFHCALQLAALQQQSGQDEEALSSYRLALSLQPAAPAALEPVAHLLARRQRHAELATLLGTAAASARDPERRAELWQRLAELSENQLADPERAARAWWRCWESDNGRQAPSELRRIYAAREQWPPYLDVLRQQVLRSAEPDDKVAVYHELARFELETLQDGLAAARTYGLILQLRPTDTEALQARVEIFLAAELPERAMHELARAARQTASGEARDALLRRLAQLQHEHQHWPALLRTLHQLSPDSGENHRFIDQLRGQTPAADDARGLRWELAKIALALCHDPATRAAFALELAQEAEEAGETPRAASYYRQVLREQEGNTAAREALDRLARAETAPPPDEALAQSAKKVIDSDPRQAIRLLVQAANIATHNRAEIERSRNYLKRALVLRESSDPAALNLLEAALREAGMHWELADLLSDAADQESEADRRKDLLRALAALLEEELDQPQRAVDVLGQALAVDPRDIALAQEIRAKHQRLGNHGALAQTLERILAVTTGKERALLLEELGLLYAEHLGDPESALRHYGEILSLRPDHPEALAFCRRYNEEVGDHRAVAAMLSRAAEVAPDTLARAELHREIAQIAEQRLGDIEFAVSHWRKVAELLPADAAPREELRRLLAQTGRWSEVEAVLLAEISRLEPEGKIPIYLELADVSVEHLDNPRAAVAYLRNALQLSPFSREIFARLEMLYEQTEQWRELSLVLRRHAEVEAAIKDKLRLLHRAAQVLLSRLDRTEEAMAICRRIREIRPGDHTSADLMTDVYARRGQWRQLAALLREQIGAESDPDELGRLQLKLGRILLERLDDPEAAATHFELAFELDAGGLEVMPLLREIYSSMGRWDQLVELIRRRAGAEDRSPTDRALALCEIGRICEEHQDDYDSAWEAYENAIHLAPQYRPALSALRGLAVTRRQWRDAVGVARRELKLLDDPPERARLLLEIADLLQHKLNRTNAAIDALQEALDNDPNNIEAAERLAAMFFDAGDWEKAGRFLERVVTSGVELRQLHDYYYRLGYACERLGRHDEAFGYYVKSFGREPLYLPTLERLVELCYQRRQWDNALRITEAIVDTYGERKSQLELADLQLRLALCHLHLAQREVAVARLQEMVVGAGNTPHTELAAWQEVADVWAATPLDPQLLPRVDQAALSRATTAAEQALTHAPDHLEALELLAAVSIVHEDWPRALRHLERAIAAAQAVEGPPRQQVQLLVCAGDIAAYRLRSTADGEAYYRRALEMLPGFSLARQRLRRLREGSTPRSRPRRPPALPTIPVSAKVSADMPPLPAEQTTQHPNEQRTPPRPAPTSLPPPKKRPKR